MQFEEACWFFFFFKPEAINIFFKRDAWTVKEHGERSNLIQSMKGRLQRRPIRLSILDFFYINFAINQIHKTVIILFGTESNLFINNETVCLKGYDGSFVSISCL